MKATSLRSELLELAPIPAIAPRLNTLLQGISGNLVWGALRQCISSGTFGSEDGGVTEEGGAGVGQRGGFETVMAIRFWEGAHGYGVGQV